jgi:flagellar M-ring protein FliF
MRAQVTAEIDFTQIERTQELFDSQRPSLRSEQVIEEESTNGSVGGVPGALTNQPPGAATIQNGESNGLGADEIAELQLGSRTRRNTRNFELDRTISHVREAPASLRRLSVAVVVDHREVIGDDGVTIRVPRDAAEIEYLRSLVEQAVGFDAERGDRVNLVNASFREISQAEPLPPAPVWEAPWVRDLIKQLLAALGVLLLILLVLRPLMKGLAQPVRRAAVPVEPDRLAGPRAAGGALAAPGAQHQVATSAGPVSLEDGLTQARSLAQEDPRIVAQVVRQWMVTDEK